MYAFEFVGIAWAGIWIDVGFRVARFACFDFYFLCVIGVGLVGLWMPLWWVDGCACDLVCGLYKYGCFR